MLATTTPKVLGSQPDVSPDVPYWRQLGSPLLVSVNAAAKMLGIGTTKTWEMVREGILPHRKFGRAVRIPVSAIQRLVDGDAAGNR